MANIIFNLNVVFILSDDRYIGYSSPQHILPLRYSAEYRSARNPIGAYYQLEL